MQAHNSNRRNWQFQLKMWLGRSAIAGDSVPLLLSIAIGVVTGFGAYVFIELLEVVGHLAEGVRENRGVVGGISMMVLAGFAVGLIITRFASEAKGHGVPEVMEAIALRRGRIRPRVAAAKIIASTITIGAGGSAGREGPIVQVGSALGSAFGQRFRLSDEQVSVLVASGAAAGISAAFNAPIAGAMFALEVILGRFSNRYLGVVVVASVAANVVSRALVGEAPAFQVPMYTLNSALELPLYALMAVLCALGAILFIRVLYAAEHYFDHLPLALPWRTALGMGLTGVVALAAPQVLGSGLEFIGESITNDMSLGIGLMLALFFLKLLATTFTLGTGNSGGVFAPGLFMGAMIGGVIGQVGYQLWPQTVSEPGAFALVGMAALFAGAARAPISAIIIVLEMSNDYRLILPLLMCVMITTLLTELLHPDTIYTRKLRLRGVHLQYGQDVDVLQSVQVHEVMNRDYIKIKPDTTLRHLMPMFNTSHHHGFPIVDDDERVLGIVTLTDLERATRNETALETPVTQIGTTQNLITVYPDDAIHIALRRMNVYHIGRLPVVSRESPDHYLGMIRRENILRAYDIGLARKSIEQHRNKHFKLRDVERNTFIEVVVEADAPMVGHTLSEFKYSSNCLLVSVRRNAETMIAHGHTRIQVGDRITAYAEPTAHHTFYQQFAPSLCQHPEALVR